jgi:hypothetical protein
LTFPVKDGDLRTAILHCPLTISNRAIPVADRRLDVPPVQNSCLGAKSLQELCSLGSDAYDEIEIPEAITVQDGGSARLAWPRRRQGPPVMYIVDRFSALDLGDQDVPNLVAPDRPEGESPRCFS